MLDYTPDTLPVWLPDFIVPVQYPIFVYNAGNAYTYTLSASDWFSNIVDFWLHLADYFTRVVTTGGDMSVVVVLDPLSPNFGHISITNNTANTLIIDVSTEIRQASGLVANPVIFPGNTLTAPNPIEGSFFPIFQVASYVKGYDAGNSVVTRTVDNSFYSQRQHDLEYRDIDVLLCRFDDDRQELESWINLYDTRWRRGRAVTLFLDRTNVNVYGSSKRDILKLEDPYSVDLDRLITNKHAVSKTGPINFSLKKSRPDPYLNLRQVSFTHYDQITEPPLSFYESRTNPKRRLP